MNIDSTDNPIIIHQHIDKNRIDTYIVKISS